MGDDVDVLAYLWNAEMIIDFEMWYLYEQCLFNTITVYPLNILNTYVAPVEKRGT